MGDNLKKSSRNVYLDVVKYVAIFLVLWGHVVGESIVYDAMGLPITDVNPNFDGIIKLIYTMHMPLFMGLCGYFLSQSVSRHPDYIHTKLRSRLLGLVCPMLAFGFVKMLLNMIDKGTAVLNVHNFIVQVHGIWFLGDLAINTVLIVFILQFLNGNARHDWKYFLFVLPFSCIPILGYGSQGLFMYFYFVAGYVLDAYYRDKGYLCYLKYAPYVLIAYLFILMAYCLMPFPPHLFTLKNISLETITNDIFRILLGFTGCYVVLFVIWHFVQWKQDSWLQNRAVKMGGYTLDIYLLNIVILEMVGGEYVYPWLIRNVFHENILQAHGFFFETVSTFVTVCVMMEIIILVSRILNYWSLTAKFFFFRDTNKPCHVIVVSSHNE